MWNDCAWARTSEKTRVNPQANVHGPNQAAVGASANMCFHGVPRVGIVILLQRMQVFDAVNLQNGVSNKFHDKRSKRACFPIKPWYRFRWHILVPFRPRTAGPFSVLNYRSWRAASTATRGNRERWPRAGANPVDSKLVFIEE